MPTRPGVSRKRRRLIFIAFAALLALAAAITLSVHLHNERVEAEKRYAAAVERALLVERLAHEEEVWNTEQRTKADRALAAQFRTQAAELHAAVQAAVDGAAPVLASSEGKATAETRTALQAAIDQANASHHPGVWNQMRASIDAVNGAKVAVEQSVAAWEAEQARLAAERAAREAAERAAREAAAKKAKQAATQPRSTQPRATQPRSSQPRLTVQAAPPATGQSVAEIFAAHIRAAGGHSFTVSDDYAGQCPYPDNGPNWVQGCVQFGHTGVIYMKPVSAKLARGDAGKYVALHEYAHILQQRIGYHAVQTATDAVFGAGNGIEQSADCVAYHLGAPRRGGYTTDCSGPRGEMAARIANGWV